MEGNPCDRSPATRRIHPEQRRHHIPPLASGRHQQDPPPFSRTAAVARSRPPHVPEGKIRPRRSPQTAQRYPATGGRRMPTARPRPLLRSASHFRSHTQTLTHPARLAGSRQNGRLRRLQQWPLRSARSAHTDSPPRTELLMPRSGGGVSSARAVRRCWCGRVYGGSLSALPVPLAGAGR